MNDKVDYAEMDGSSDRPVVVGIGASAGGLEAISRLLKGIPNDSGLSFVIVQPRDPTHKSSLVEILSRRTSLPVQQVDEDTEIQPDHIYVIPPGQYLSIESCVLKLSEPQDPRGSRMAIDYFLTSLAEDACEFGIGVVLSGTGSDGTAGLQEIKHYGGLTVVQDPSEAEHTGMPQSAIDAVHVDYVLPAEEVGSRLGRYVEFCRNHGPLSAQSVAQAEQSDLSPILDLLRKKTKHDFRRYRKNTLIRRVRRRMGLHQLDQISDYQALLADNPKERDALRCDLLIGVTRFFRDPESFATPKRGRSLKKRWSVRCLIPNARSRFVCGAPDAPPARKRTRSPCCCWSKWAPIAANCRFKSSRLTLPRTRCLSHARVCTPKRS